MAPPLSRWLTPRPLPCLYKAKRLSWNSGKPHGQNVHWIEILKQNLPPLTRHENAPVSTQGLCFVQHMYIQCQVRDAAWATGLKRAPLMRLWAAHAQVAPPLSRWLTPRPLPCLYKAKRLSWNSGKPHGQNVHWIEILKQNLPPLTRHGNAPVLTQGLCFVLKKWKEERYTLVLALIVIIHW